ncbi:MAG: hypothetical protein WCL32_19170, partial [Planctomycetota bacterium]
FIAALDGRRRHSPRQTVKSRRRRPSSAAINGANRKRRESARVAMARRAGRHAPELTVRASGRSGRERRGDGVKIRRGEDPPQPGCGPLRKTMGMNTHTADLLSLLQISAGPGKERPVVEHLRTVFPR